MVTRSDTFKSLHIFHEIPLSCMSWPSNMHIRKSRRTCVAIVSYVWARFKSLSLCWTVLVWHEDHHTGRRSQCVEDGTTGVYQTPISSPSRAVLATSWTQQWRKRSTKVTRGQGQVSCCAGYSCRCRLLWKTNCRCRSRLFGWWRTAVTWHSGHVPLSTRLHVVHTCIWLLL